MHRLVIRTVKSSESLSYWCCDCNFRNRTEQSHGLHVHVHLDLWLNKYCLWCDQSVSKPKLLQAHDLHLKSQDFPNWIHNSLLLSGCLEDSTTWTQHLIKIQVLRILHCWLYCSVGVFFSTASKQDVSRRALCYTSWQPHATTQMLKRNKWPKIASFLLNKFSPCSWVVCGNKQWLQHMQVDTELAVVPQLCHCAELVEVLQWAGTAAPAKSSASTQCFYFETWKRNPGIIRLILWLFCKELSIFCAKIWPFFCSSPCQKSLCFLLLLCWCLIV